MDCRKVEGTDKVALENVRHFRFTTTLRLICDNDTQPRLAQTQRKTLFPSNITGLHREIS